MPRPKRSKINSLRSTSRSNTTKSLELSDAAFVGLKEQFDDLYDVSDQEDNRTLHSPINKREKGKEKLNQNSSSRHASREIELEQSKAMEKDYSSQRKRSVSKFDCSLSSSSPSIEISRQQPTPITDRLALAMDNLRTLAHSDELDFFEAHNSGKNGLDKDKNVGFTTERRASMLKQSTSQKNPTQTSQSPAIVSQYGNDYGDGVSFDASTPLNIKSVKELSSSASLSSSKSKKRKLSGVQVLQSSYEAPCLSLSETDEVIPATNQHNTESYSSLEVSEENVLPSVESGSLTPEDIREIMAPPHSSSSLLSSPIAPSKSLRASSRNLRNLKGRSSRMRFDSDTSSPPSLTHSPDLSSTTTSKSKSKKEQVSPITLSTAQLKALLPKRRRRIARDIFDKIDSDDEIDVSGLASDEDELTHLIVSSRASNRNAKSLNDYVVRGSRLRKKLIQINQTKAIGLGISGLNDESNANAMDATGTSHGNRSPIDYSITARENIEELDKRAGKELRKAVQKFKEVDKWVLDFEDATSSSASPKDAR